MSGSIRRGLRRAALTLGVGAAALLPARAWTQELPPPAPPAATEAAEDAVDRAEQAQETREEVRETRQTAADFQISDYGSADFGLWFDRAADQGLMISDVATTGMIADLGFVEGDRIVSLNGRPVASEADFMNFLFAPQFRDQRVQVLVDRNGVQETIVVEPSALIREVGMVAPEDALEELGIVLDDRYPDRALIWKVVRRSPAFYAGIRPGDLITGINRQKVVTADQAHEAAANLGPGPVAIQVSRGDRFRDVQVDLTQSAPAPRARLEGELAPPRAPAAPQAVTPPAPPPNPPATVATPAPPPVVTPAPAPNVVVPADPTPRVTPRATRPVRPGLFPRLRQR
jgi:predicted metalloprotease with PDZ domain